MKSYSQNKFKAFTLIELLVAISIIGLMATLSISAYPKFSEQVGVTSQTYKLLAYMRETQTYGTSAVSTPGTRFVYSFLVDKSENSLKRFSWPSPSSRSNQNYVQNSTLDVSAEILNLKEQYEIEKICGGQNCVADLDKAYVFFRRPNPEGRIVGLQGTNILPGLDDVGFDRLEITIRSKRTKEFTKKVVVLSTGQTYVSDW
jgi:prepilin-type N-terminal cleavage/methylation domain-containing protein